MSINIRAIGMALTASSRLVPPEVVPPLPTPELKDHDDDSYSVWHSNRMTDRRPGPQIPPVLEGKKFYTLSAYSARAWKYLFGTGTPQTWEMFHCVSCVRIAFPRGLRHRHVLGQTGSKRELGSVGAAGLR